MYHLLMDVNVSSRHPPPTPLACLCRQWGRTEIQELHTLLLLFNWRLRLPLPHISFVYSCTRCTLVLRRWSDWVVHASKTVFEHIHNIKYRILTHMLVCFFITSWHRTTLERGELGGLSRAEHLKFRRPGIKNGPSKGVLLENEAKRRFECMRRLAPSHFPQLRGVRALV